MNIILLVYRKGKCMKSKQWLRNVYLCLLVLILITAVVAVPVTWGRYAAVAQVQATGRVAAWDPEVEVADAWGEKIAFIASDGVWMPVTDGTHLSTARGDEWAFRPNNTGSEVAAKFNYSITATGAQPWVHFDVGGLNAVNVVGTYSDFREDVFAPLADTPTSMTPAAGLGNGMGKQEIFVYLIHAFRPYTQANCYAKATFSWTAEQID